MPNQPAELFFPTHSVSVSASVVDTQQDGSVVLASPGLSFSAIRSSGVIGSSVWITVLEGREAYRIPCTVQGFQEPLVLVVPTSAPEKIPPRGRHRYPCSLPVVFREKRSGAASGAWLEAHAVDVNMAGMQLETARIGVVPVKIELKVALPACLGDDTPSRVASGDSETNQVVGITGRINHWREIENGMGRAGVQFEYLTPKAVLKLGSYLEFLSRIQL